MKVLDGSIGFLLARTARSMKRTLEARLAEYNITATQYIVLEVLADQDGISLSRMGNRLYFDNPTITGIIDRMERDGLVERRRIADDRRVINIFLTQKGRDILRRIGEVAREVNDEATSDLSEKEKADFIHILNSIWKKMNEHAVRHRNLSHSEL